MPISFKTFLRLLHDYKITAIVAVACLGIFALLHQEGLQREQLFYFSSLSIFTLLSEPWRVLSPIFLHHTPLHLIGNLIIWLEFARQIEKHQGAWALLFLLVFIAIGSNTAEYLMLDHRFGGLSGVVIGLGAYIGLLSLQPKQTPWDFPLVYWLALIGLFVFDMTGQNGQVAHYVHGTGLVLGLACGVIVWIMSHKTANLLSE